MTNWRHEPDDEPGDPLRVSRWVMWALTLVLVAAWVAAAAMFAMGCSSSPRARCPDPRASGCDHHVVVRRTEQRCRACGEPRGEVELVVWDMGAR